MGTSLSGLTPATTFDGLLKTSDNEPLNDALKTIGTGDGTDSILQLSNSALQIGGDLSLNGKLTNTANNVNINDVAYFDGVNSRLGVGTSAPTYDFEVSEIGLGKEAFIGSIYNGTRYDGIKLGSNSNGVGFIQSISNTAYDMYIQPEGGNIYIGSSTGAPQARTHIKGSGTTSATTSLLVQNSAGNTSLEVLDNRDVKFNLGAYQFLSNGFTSFSPVYVNNNARIGLGGSGASVARLQVKGSGNDATTTALLVQNSDGVDMLKVTDDKKLRFIGQFDLLYNSSFGIVKNTQSLTLKDYTINNQIFTAGAFKSVLYSDAASGGFVGINNTTPTAQLHIKGLGNDATTTALLVQNSDGNDLMEVEDGGNVGIGQSSPLSATLHIKSQSYFYNTTAFRIQNSIGNNLFRVRGDGTTDILNSRYIFYKATEGTGGAVFKGSGTTSATTALLVQNSAGTDLLKIEDGGNIRLGGNVYASQYIFNGSATATWMRFVPSTHQIELSTNANKMVVVKSNGVGINTDTADASAVLQADSTTQGFLPPRMTDAERDAIATPAAGLMIYDTTNNQMNYWNGSTWIAF